MEDQKNNNGENHNEVVFNVMPQNGKNIITSANLGPSEAPPASYVSYASGSSRRWLYIGIGVVVLLILAGGAYYLLGDTKKDDTTNQPASRLSKAWLTQYFNVDTCSDQATCGESADPESDGLGNYDEFKAGTNPLNPDTDSDGLADGDEVNIFKTEPTLKFTDRREVVATNNWTDGYQIKNGFDPLTPALKFTEVRKKQILDSGKQFKLHEPSITTLSAQMTPTPAPSPTPPAN